MKSITVPIAAALLVAASPLAAPAHAVAAAPTSTTTIGVHDLAVLPDSGDDFRPGSSGTAAFSIRPNGGSPGLTVKTGQRLVWTIELPAGITPTLPAAVAKNGWSTSFTRAQSPGGGTTVTRTSLRTGADDTDAGASGGRVSFPVTAGSFVVDGAPATAVFTPAPGWTSSAASDATTVPFDAWRPITLDAVEVGSPDGAGVSVAMSGTATPRARILVRSTQSSDRYVTTTVDDTGHWSVTRTWSASHRYALSIEQTDGRGRSDAVPYGPWTPGTA